MSCSCFFNKIIGNTRTQYSNTMWYPDTPTICCTQYYVMLIGYPNTSDTIQLSLKLTSSPSQIYPPQVSNPKSLPYIYWCKGKNVSYLYYIDQARFKHHAAIDYPSSAWFFLSSFREKFRCHARLPGYQGKGLIASSPYSLLTFARNLWKIH